MSERILVVGGGVAGSVLAYWLGKHDFDVTVVERSQAEQKAGQGIEIEDSALDVVKAMGIMDELRKIRTGEEGFKLLDEQGRSRGYIPVGGLSPTGALEVMRGDLTQVLYKAADVLPNVRYRFNTVIKSLSQTADTVTVELEERGAKKSTSSNFDMVIGADGVNSRTRDLVWGPVERSRVGAFVAYFSVPSEPRDWPNSELCHYPGRRILWKRPVARDSDTTSVYLIHVAESMPAFTGDRQKQKAAFAELYKGLGWEAPRMMREVLRSENFYADELAQIKMPQWWQGRVALVGDSAWAPTPFTGQGNQLAIIGGFVMAQELSRNRSPAAFAAYDTRLRAYVNKSQQIPLYGYAPYIFTPQTNLGIWIFRSVFIVVAAVMRIVNKFTGVSEAEAKHQPGQDFDLQMQNP